MRTACCQLYVLYNKHVLICASGEGVESLYSEVQDETGLNMSGEGGVCTVRSHGPGFPVQWGPMSRRGQGWTGGPVWWDPMHHG